ncbi:MAG: RNA 2',3'-cyclic phosphodiesterase [Thermoleophilaceae bacterium]
MSERPWRLFVALDLPEEVRAAVAGWTLGALHGRGDLRPVPEAALHVTLVFLGGVEPGRVADVWEAVAGAWEGCRAPGLGVSGVVGLPQDRPRLFALGLCDEAGRAAALHGAVAGALEAAELYEPGGRRFWPHVTVARVRRGARSAHMGSDPPALGRFVAPALTLYRSGRGRTTSRWSGSCCPGDGRVAQSSRTRNTGIPQRPIRLAACAAQRLRSRRQAWTRIRRRPPRRGMSR